MTWALFRTDSGRRHRQDEGRHNKAPYSSNPAQIHVFIKAVIKFGGCRLRKMLKWFGEIINGTLNYLRIGKSFLCPQSYSWWIAFINNTYCRAILDTTCFVQTLFFWPRTIFKTKCYIKYCFNNVNLYLKLIIITENILMINQERLNILYLPKILNLRD